MLYEILGVFILVVKLKVDKNSQPKNLIKGKAAQEVMRPTEELVIGLVGAVGSGVSKTTSLMAEILDLLHNRLFLCEEVPGGIIL